MDISIRRAEPRDLPALGRLGALLMRTHFDFDRLRFMNPGDGDQAAAGYARFLRHQLDDTDSAIIVAERKDDVVGYVYAGIEPLSWKELRDEAGFIHDIVVSADAREKGVARL